MGHGSLCVLSLRLDRSSPDNQENVEGQHPAPHPSTPSLTHSTQEHRLVLHLLRAPIPTLRHPPRHHSPLVPLPIPRPKPPLDAPLGHRRHQGPAVGRTSLDVLRDHLRRGTRLRIPHRGCHAVCLDVEASEGQDVFEEGPEHVMMGG